MADPSLLASREADRIRRLARDVEPSLCCPEAVADCVAGFGADRLRYVAAWRRWMLWDGARWRPDDTQRAFDLARDLSRAILNGVRRTCSDGVAARVARRMGGAGFMAEAARIAGADRRLAASPAQFDADASLLNTPAGTVDTRTGALTPHRADAFLTRIAEVAPADPGTPCPAWDGLIARMTGGDAELHFFLQRVVGRALARRSAGPGSASAAGREHPLIDTIALILGDGTASAAIREGLDMVRLDPVARDPDLADRLAGEYAAILRWTIDGGLAWRRIGLAPPARARRPDAAAAIGRFLSQDAEASPSSWVSAGDLYARWRNWTAAAGLEAGSPKAFAQAVAAMGFTPARRHGGRRGFAGLRLRGAESSPSVTAGVDGIGVAPVSTPLIPSPLAGGDKREGSARGRQDNGDRAGLLDRTESALRLGSLCPVAPPPPDPLPPLRLALRRQVGPDRDRFDCSGSAACR